MITRLSGIPGSCVAVYHQVAYLFQSVVRILCIIYRLISSLPTVAGIEDHPCSLDQQLNSLQFV